MTGARARWAAVFGVATAVSALLTASGWLAPPGSRTAAAREPDSCTGGVTRRVTEAGYRIDTAGAIDGTHWCPRQDSDPYTVDTEPATGKVERGARFPEGRADGSVALDAGAIHTAADRDGHRGTTYRLPCDGPAVEIVIGLPLLSIGAAGCYCPCCEPTPPSSPPPPEPPPSPPSPPAPTPSPTTSAAPPSPRQEPPPPPVKRPVIPPPTKPKPAPPPATTTPTPALPPSATPTPTPAPSAPPTSHHARPLPKPQPVVADTGRRTQEKRRWGLTALILVLGGGAAVAHVRRHR